MATLSEVKMLRNILVKTRFHFVPKGTHKLQDILKSVKSFYSTICDDNVTRTDNGEKEWHHQVRLALNDLRDKPVVIKTNQINDGIWEFN